MIKELWSNKRYRAILQLVAFGIFFLFVFLVMNSSSKAPIEVIKTKYEKLESVFEYTYTVDDKIIIVNGNQYIYENKRYTEETLPVDIINPIQFSKLIQEGELISSNYVDGYDTYRLSIELYESIVGDTEEEILINVYEEEEIYKIEIEVYNILFEKE